jgi:ADP-heptose:LPS heptosyltransferase
MYLLQAPVSKFGLIPSGNKIICDDVKFFNNVGLCTKQYWYKVHINAGCVDVSPQNFKELRKQRPIKSCLIMALGGIGDSLWNMPIARAIKEQNLDCCVCVCPEPKAAPLWKHVPYVSSLVTSEFWSLQAVINTVDQVYDFGGIATYMKQFKNTDPVEAIFKLAEIEPYTDKSKMRPWLVCTADEGQKAQAFLREKNVNTKTDKIVTICVEASTANRNYPKQHILELTKALINSGYKTIWIGESKDYRLDEGLADHEKKCHANLVGKTNLRESMATIALSDCVVAPNSSMMVVAASLCIPTVGLFGAFDFRTRTKYYDKFFAIQGQACKSPCGDHWTECPFGHPAPCMRDITPGLVFDTVEKAISQYPRNPIHKEAIE